jgi:protein-disulfide isomerase
MAKKKALVLATAASLLTLFGVVTIVCKVNESKPIEMNTGGFLSIGKMSAPVEIVLIEDFRCKNCCKFSEKILPKIYGKYVKTGKARFVLVPVAFLSGSQSVANAALQVYQNHPDRFFSFLKEILAQAQEGEMKAGELVRLARRIGGINLANLQGAVEQGSYDIELAKNMEWARNLMGARFKTPAIYINGVRTDSFSYESVAKEIERRLP